MHWKFMDTSYNRTSAHYLLSKTTHIPATLTNLLLCSKTLCQSKSFILFIHTPVFVTRHFWSLIQTIFLNPQSFDIVVSLQNIWSAQLLSFPKPHCSSHFLFSEIHHTTKSILTKTVYMVRLGKVCSELTKILCHMTHMMCQFNKIKRYHSVEVQNT